VLSWADLSHKAPPCAAAIGILRCTVAHMCGAARERYKDSATQLPGGVSAASMSEQTRGSLQSKIESRFQLVCR